MEKLVLLVVKNITSAIKLAMAFGAVAATLTAVISAEPAHISLRAPTKWVLLFNAISVLYALKMKMSHIGNEEAVIQEFASRKLPRTEILSRYHVPYAVFFVVIFWAGWFIAAIVLAPVVNALR